MILWWDADGKQDRNEIGRAQSDDDESGKSRDCRGGRHDADEPGCRDDTACRHDFTDAEPFHETVAEQASGRDSDGKNSKSEASRVGSDCLGGRHEKRSPVEHDTVTHVHDEAQQSQKEDTAFWKNEKGTAFSFIAVRKQVSCENGHEQYDQGDAQTACGGQWRQSRFQQQGKYDRSEKTTDTVHAVEPGHHAAVAFLFDKNGLNVHGDVHHA